MQKGTQKLHSLTLGEIPAEGFVKGLGGVHEHIVNPALETLALEAVDEVIHRFGVGFLTLLGLGEEFFAGL